MCVFHILEIPFLSVPLPHCDQRRPLGISKVWNLLSPAIPPFDRWISVWLDGFLLTSICWLASISFWPGSFTTSSMTNRSAPAFLFMTFITSALEAKKVAERELTITITANKWWECYTQKSLLLSWWSDENLNLNHPENENIVSLF